MNSIVKQVQGWTAQQWQTRVAAARPSSGGAVGVVFVWVAAGGGPAIHAQPTTTAAPSFVIKPVQGSAGPTKFAEHMLGKIANAVSPHSKPIGRHTPAGVALVAMLDARHRAETDVTTKARWAAVLPHYRAAGAFLIQEVQQGITEFGDKAREFGGLRQMVTNRTLMINLGKLFAADAFIGNGDRLYSVNGGNIIFRPDGKLCAIDSAAVLTNYQQVLNSEASWGPNYDTFNPPSKVTPGTWAKSDVVKRAGGAVVPAGGVSPTSFAVSQVFAVDQWWDNEFRPHLNKSTLNADKANAAQGLPRLPQPTLNEWDNAKRWFKLGVDEGLREVDRRLSGFNWLKLKFKFQSYSKKYGTDPNLDWTNLKIRRRYFQARNKGKTEDQALAEVEAYANRKLA